MLTINDLRGQIEDEILRKLEVLKVNAVSKFNLKYINLDKILQNLSKEAKITCLVLSEHKIDNITEILKKRNAISPKTSIIVMLSSKIGEDDIIIATVKE